MDMLKCVISEMILYINLKLSLNSFHSLTKKTRKGSKLKEFEGLKIPDISVGDKMSAICLAVQENNKCDGIECIECIYYLQNIDIYISAKGRA